MAVIIIVVGLTMFVVGFVVGYEVGFYGEG